MIDVVIIGCGAIAGGYDHDRAGLPPLSHAGAFAENPHFRLAAAVDPDAAKRVEFMARWDVPVGAASLDDLPSELAADVIVVASPTAMHGAHVAAALARKPRLIFCEKPVTPTAEASAALVAACGTADTLLAVNHTRRWAPDIVALAHELRGGTHGTLRSASGTYTKGVLNNGSHMIDLLHMLLGDVALVAAGAPVFDHWPDDPSVPCLLTAGTVPVTLNIGDARDYALFELTIVTATGTITMEDGGLAWRKRNARPSPDFPGYRTLDAGKRSDGAYAEAMRAAVANIHAALTEGAPLASDGASALAAQRLCEGIAAAAHQRPGTE